MSELEGRYMDMAMREYAFLCMETMTRQMRERYPERSEEEIIDLLLGEKTVMMAEYAKGLISDGYITHDEAEKQMRTVFGTRVSGED